MFFYLLISSYICHFKEIETQSFISLLCITYSTKKVLCTFIMMVYIPLDLKIIDVCMCGFLYQELQIESFCFGIFEESFVLSPLIFRLVSSSTAIYKYSKTSSLDFPFTSLTYALYYGRLLYHDVFKFCTRHIFQSKRITFSGYKGMVFYKIHDFLQCFF